MMPESVTRAHSRRGSASSVVADDASGPSSLSSKRTKRRKTGDLELENLSFVAKEIENLSKSSEKSKENEMNKNIKEIQEERAKLEAFLLDDSNKVTKTAIKFILEKWSVLENKMQNIVLENEILKTKNQMMDAQKTSYAQMASRPAASTPLGLSILEKAKVKDDYETILLKPDKDCDNRNNEELKKDVMCKLNETSKKLKIRNIRQMKQKGIIVQVSSKKDVDLIQKSDLGSIGLKIEKPKKVNPSIIIYDVEKEYTKEALLENFINKNLDQNVIDNFSETKKEIEFRHCFKAKDDRVNWIVQIPKEIYNVLLSKGKIYMMWRIYRIKEFLNTVRCFKCHGHGHIAKYCNAPDQLCEFCGSKEHSRENCTKKENPVCINCMRSKRKDINHNVKSKECPEYLRYLEIFKSKLKWS